MIPWRKATASASFLSVDSRCLTEKINPLLRMRPQQYTGIHDECEVRYRVFAARVGCKLRITSSVSGPVTEWQSATGEKQPLRNFSWFAYRCLWKYIHFRSLAHKRGWDTMNYTVYCRLAWPNKCIISVKCVTSTTLGDTQRMLGLLGAAPGVVTNFRRKTARCVSRNGPKSDRCHLDDASHNMSGIGLRCVSCNRPQESYS